MYISEANIKGKSKPVEVIEYSSIDEFYNYICDTPINAAFRWSKLDSVEGGEYFTKTQSFEEATDLFKNGWTDMSNKLTQRLKVIEKEIVPSTRPRQQFDVAGYQCSVPRYLQGVPTSMINKKNVPIKQKVITLNKSIDYAGYVSVDTIVEESIKALQIVKKLEAQQYRVNLNVVLGSTTGNKSIAVKIRVKNANEKLNISKLSFIMVHPSMLRRLLFRFIEVHPTITKDYVHGYGAPAGDNDLRQIFGSKEYLLPSNINKDISRINNLEDLEIL